MAKRLKVEPTERGFGRVDFKDLNGDDCSIQESSLATDDAIWLGCDSGTHMKTGECCARMHLNREQVESLLPLLNRFVRTGKLRTK